MSDRELVTLEAAQFKTLEARLAAIKDLEQSIDRQSDNIGKWLSEVNQSLKSIIAGFDKVAEELAKLQPLPQPQPKPPVEVKIVFKVADDHQEEPFSIEIGGVTDAEGQPIPDASGLNVEVVSSDEDVVAVTFDADSKSGSVSFGAPGVASVTATVTNAKGDILGSGAADFTVKTGDPAAVSDVKLTFGGLTEEPTA